MIDYKKKPRVSDDLKKAKVFYLLSLVNMTITAVAMVVIAIALY